MPHGDFIHFIRLNHDVIIEHHVWLGHALKAELRPVCVPAFLDLLPCVVVRANLPFWYFVVLWSARGTMEHSPLAGREASGQPGERASKRMRAEADVVVEPTAAVAAELHAPYTWLWPLPSANSGANSIASGGSTADAVQRRREVAVGAILCRPRDVQRVLDSLAQLQTALGRNDAMELGPIARGKVLRFVPSNPS
jgi:hypothetical protein